MKSCGQSAGCYFEPCMLYKCTLHWFLLQFGHFLCVLSADMMCSFFLLEWNDFGAPNYKTIIGYNHFYSFQKTGQ